MKCQKIILLMFMITAISPFANAEVRGISGEKCYVRVAKGSILNVRDKPYGKVLGKLKNWTQVTYDDVVDVKDKYGVPWLVIDWQGQPLKSRYRGLQHSGWVSSDFVACYH